MRKATCVMMFWVILQVSASGAAAQENVTIKIVGISKVLSVQVARDVVKLQLTKTRSMLPVLKRIEGLDQLISLRVLDLSFTEINAQTDTRFLAQASHLEEMRLGFMKIKNFDFLRYLPEIVRVIDYDFVEIQDSSLVIDLRNNKRIERLDVGTSDLASIPRVINPPVSFRILNLARNHIKDIYANSATGSVSFKIVLSDSDYYATRDRRLPNVFDWSSMRDQLAE
jgi:hypothetical protein